MSFNTELSILINKGEVFSKYFTVTSLAGDNGKTYFVDIRVKVTTGPNEEHFTKCGVNMKAMDFKTLFPRMSRGDTFDVSVSDGLIPEGIKFTPSVNKPYVHQLVKYRGFDKETDVKSIGLIKKEIKVIQAAFGQFNRIISNN
jgi:hypothetical protein